VKHCRQTAGWNFDPFGFDDVFIFFFLVRQAVGSLGTAPTRARTAVSSRCLRFLLVSLVFFCFLLWSLFFSFVFSCRLFSLLCSSLTLLFFRRFFFFFFFSQRDKKSLPFENMILAIHVITVNSTYFQHWKTLQLSSLFLFLFLFFSFLRGL